MSIIMSASRLRQSISPRRNMAPTLTPFVRAKEAYLRPTVFSNGDIIQRLRDGGADVVDVSLDKQQAAGEPVIIKGEGHATGLGNHLLAADSRIISRSITVRHCRLAAMAGHRFAPARNDSLR
jgi:hypothetical protein